MSSTATASATTGWFRFGVIGLPLAGALHALSYVLPLPGPGTEAGADPTALAHAFTSASWFVGMLSPVVGLALLMLGMIALASHVAGTRGSAWATAGLAIGILGIALYLPFRGILAYAMPAAARAYLDGSAGAMDMLRAIGASGFNPITIGSTFLLWASFVAFGVAVWRSQTLPRWAAVLVAIDGLLLHGPLFGIRVAGLPVISILGAVLLTLGGAQIAVRVLRETPSSDPGGSRSR